MKKKRRALIHSFREPLASSCCFGPILLPPMPLYFFDYWENSLVLIAKMVPLDSSRHTLWQVLWSWLDRLWRWTAMWWTRYLLQATWFLCGEERLAPIPFLKNTKMFLVVCVFLKTPRFSEIFRILPPTLIDIWLLLMGVLVNIANFRRVLMFCPSFFHCVWEKQTFQLI